MKKEKEKNSSTSVTTSNYMYVCMYVCYSGAFTPLKPNSNCQLFELLFTKQQSNE